MNAAVAVMFELAASHTAPCCVRTDGHLWIVRVVVDGEPKVRTGMVTDIEALRGACAALASELSGTHLNDMLPGVIPTPEGVAAYLHERLIAGFPVTRVAVDMRPGYRAELEWPRR